MATWLGANYVVTATLFGRTGLDHGRFLLHSHSIRDSWRMQLKFSENTPKGCHRLLDAPGRLLLVNEESH